MIRVGEKIENRFFSFLDEKYIEKKKKKKKKIVQRFRSRLFRIRMEKRG